MSGVWRRDELPLYQEKGKTGILLSLFFGVIFLLVFSMLLVLCVFGAFSSELWFCRSQPYPDWQSFLRLFSKFELVPSNYAASLPFQLHFPPG